MALLGWIAVITKAAWKSVTFVARQLVRSGRVLALVELAHLWLSWVEPVMWQQSEAHDRLARTIGHWVAGVPYVAVIGLALASVALFSSGHELADVVIGWVGVAAAFFAAWLEHGAEGPVVLATYTVVIVALMASVYAMISVVPLLLTAVGLGRRR